jgi:hypothetical protein
MNLPCGSSISRGDFVQRAQRKWQGVPVSWSLGYLRQRLRSPSPSRPPPPRLLSSRTTAPTCGMRVGRTVRVGPARLILICRGQGRWDQGRCDPSRVFGRGTGRGTQDRVEGICELGPLVAMGALLLFFCLRWRLGWVPVERAWESGGGEREWRDLQPLLLVLLLLRIQQQIYMETGSVRFTSV